MRRGERKRDIRIAFSNFSHGPISHRVTVGRSGDGGDDDDYDDDDDDNDDNDGGGGGDRHDR